MDRLVLDRRQLLKTAGVGSLGLLAAACGGLAAGPGSSANPKPSPSPTMPRIRVRAFDYRFEAPTEVPAGLTEVVFENLGQYPHALSVLKAKDGAAVGDVQALLVKSRSSALPLTAALLGGTDFVGTGSGGSQSVQIEFDEGQFFWLSNANAPDGSNDQLKGMVAPFKVAPAASSAPLVEAATNSVSLTDTGPVLRSDARAGQQIWSVKAASDAHAVHTLSVARLGSGKTLADWLAWRQQPSGSSPIEELTGANALGPGDRTVRLPVYLGVGAHVAYCSILLPEFKQDHVAKGEVLAFSVS